MGNGYVVGYDATRGNIPLLPRGAQMYAGYSTGLGDVPWTGADFAAHATILGPCLRIDQDPAASDATADILDVERGAATVADSPGWARRAQADFNVAVRPGQRSPAVYMNAATVTAVVNALVAGGVTSGVGLVVANWSITEGQAVVDVLGAAGPFPVVGVQFADAGPYDVDVFSRAWLERQAGGPADWQEAMMSTLPTISVTQNNDDAHLTHWYVHRVQAIANGVFAASPALKVDGAYGAVTEAAVKTIQGTYGLTVDGIVGKQTWMLLLAAIRP